MGATPTSFCITPFLALTRMLLPIEPPSESFIEGGLQVFFFFCDLFFFFVFVFFPCCVFVVSLFCCLFFLFLFFCSFLFFFCFFLFHLCLSVVPLSQLRYHFQVKIQIFSPASLKQPPHEDKTGPCDFFFSFFKPGLPHTLP